jgi:hypothetical protein
MLKSRRIRCEGNVARMREKRHALKVLEGMPEGKRPPGRPRRRRVVSIKLDLAEKGRGGADWIRLAQDSDQ